MRKGRAKHFILAASTPFVLYAILGGFLGRALARDSAYRYLSVFQDVVTLIMNNYLEPPEMDRVMDGAMRGMMEALDPDSCYLSPEEFKAFRNPDEQAKAGIGVEVTKRYYLQVVSVLPGSPAEKAGLLAGDLIKSIDGANTRELNVIVGDMKLHGRAGTSVALEIIRGRQPDPIEFTVDRVEVVASPVEFEMLEDGTGYMKVSGFRPGSDTDVMRAVEMLKNQGIDRLVVDVRDSYGRLAEDGAKVAELFAGGGVAARIESRKGESTELALASGRVVYEGPMVVLANRATSGAAEIFAGAIRGAERADVVGERTSGRSSVQRAISLGDGAGIVLSVGQFFTPDGQALLGEGLEPTVEVQRSVAGIDDGRDEILERGLEVLAETAMKKAA
jgi:carboxyl-terminal processing protease